MTFSKKVKRVITLGEQFATSPDAAARRDLENETRAFMASLPAAEVYMLITLMYLGRGGFGIAGLLDSYVQMSDKFHSPQRATGQMLEEPFGQYLAKGVSQLERAKVDLDSLLGSFLESPIASVDDGSAIQLKIGPWSCDECGQLIERAEDGMLQWLVGTVEDRHVGRDLRIVHHLPASPLGPPNGCDPVERHELELDGFVLADGHLETYLGPNGLVDLLSKIEDAELPASDVNKVIMRLFVPGYEQARRYFDRAVSTGLVSPIRLPGYFIQDEMKTIVANIHRLND